MTNFMKYLLFIVLFTSHIFACALCKFDVPLLSVEANVTALAKKTHFQIKWHFHPTFIAQLVEYDEDDNGIYDENEKAKIQNALEVYIQNYNYLSKISYIKQGLNENKVLLIEPNLTKMVISKNAMYYQFDFDADFILEGKYVLKFIFEDAQINFNFLIDSITLNNYKGKYNIKTNLNQSQIILDDAAIPQKKLSKEIKPNTPNTQSSFYAALAKQLTVYKGKIKAILQDIKKNNTVTSYFWLLFFSFVYGILHAIGPGHGKTLVSSYFLSDNRSVFKAFNISLLIGVVHTFSAFFLTVFIYFLLDFVFNSFITNVEYVASKISAVVIILIALYLIYKKFKASKQIKTMSFTSHNPNLSTCGCHACHTKSEDIGVILAAGIVPCPGTVTIFIFTFGLGIYYIGFLSAIFMSLGMSLIIFITAYLSINIRKKSSSSTRLIKFLEYGSLVFILLLGLFLLLV